MDCSNPVPPRGDRAGQRVACSTAELHIGDQERRAGPRLRQPAATRQQRRGADGGADGGAVGTAAGQEQQERALHLAGGSRARTLPLLSGRCANASLEHDDAVFSFNQNYF